MVKKCNAVLGLAIIAVFLIHIIYEIYAYLTFYYNPVLTKAIAHTALGTAALHVLISIFIIFFMHDRGNGMKYPALNVRTLLQRISAFAIVPLMIVHMNTFSLLGMTSEAAGPLFLTVLAVQALFYADVLLHIGLSTGNALITLGIITTGKVRKTTDITVWTLCVILFIAAVVIITRTQLAMFSGGSA